MAQSELEAPCGQMVQAMVKQIQGPGFDSLLDIFTNSSPLLSIMVLYLFPSIMIHWQFNKQAYTFVNML